MQKISVRRSRDRGQTRLEWLDSRHSFSFGDYYDPRHMSFGPLRVINEDRVAPDGGFATHGHRDMEILTWVLDGALAHQDSLGNGSVIRPGEMQRMSAGTGIRHSEFNASQEEPVHFLQIWVLPERNDLPPSYEQKAFHGGSSANRFRLLASRDGREDSVIVHQDVNIYGASLSAGRDATLRMTDGRRAWVQMNRGTARIADVALAAGDGAAIEDAPEIRVVAEQDAELLLFDLP